MRTILEGLRVLDVESFAVGPAAATVMADLAPTW
jgi:crotonobetainyl-CoA:carnitine CoA-transferase CaiB-like acyl-CoA transferase